MRTFTKKLRVKIRTDHAHTLKAMEKVIARYVNKMAAKGWERADGTEFNGTSFLCWEHIITMKKTQPTNAGIQSPESGSIITGEAGDNIGRGKGFHYFGKKT